MPDKNVRETILSKIEAYRKDDVIIDNDVPLKVMGLDSMDIMRLIVELEEHFNITFEDDELIIDNFKTVNKIVTKINNRLIFLNETS